MSFYRVLQTRLDSDHPQKDLVVNAVHHGCMHRDMNSSAGFSAKQVYHIYLFFLSTF